MKKAPENYNLEQVWNDILFLSRIIEEILPVVDYLNEDLLRHRMDDLREQNKTVIKTLYSRLEILEERIWPEGKQIDLNNNESNGSNQGAT